jgi:thioredoxin-like negative regulator of GroEL
VNAHDQLFTERAKQVTEWLDQHEARDQERHLELKQGLAEVKTLIQQGPSARAADVLAIAAAAASDLIRASQESAKALIESAKVVSTNKAR